MHGVYAMSYLSVVGSDVHNGDIYASANTFMPFDATPAISPPIGEKHQMITSPLYSSISACISRSRGSISKHPTRKVFLQAYPISYLQMQQSSPPSQRASQHIALLQ